ncbi:MAG: roadblock/LC7 domain-containing protein [Methylovulum sp.]|nr:roadblock/LC7 domain-containing protein [Methylovulum sp.]
MHTILAELNKTDTKIKASAVTSVDGVVLVYQESRQELNEDDVCGMAAAIFAVSQRSIATLVGGGLKQIVVTGEDGYVLVTMLDEATLLVAVTHAEIDLPSVLEKMSHLGANFAARPPIGIGYA